MKRIANYIGGELVAPLSGVYLDNACPATGEIYSQVPASDERDIDQAVQAGKAAFAGWSGLTPQQRAGYLRKIADAIDARLDELAEAESVDNGKPVRLARSVDIPRASANFRFFASAIEQFASEAHPMAGLAVNYTLRQPLGVAGCISPWNLPLYLFSWKIAPALAAGNCVVGKPSEITPVTAYLLAQICREIDLPTGVLNIVHGTGEAAGSALVGHPEVRAMSFTGGTLTGRKIAAIAAPQFKKLSLELGGKNPNLIFADCDYDAMLDTTVRAAFSNQGEICLCGSRIFIERALYAKFRDDFVARARALRVGDPASETTDIGAIVSKPHYEKILGYIDLARQEGGKVLCGGRPVKLQGRCAGGWFIEPTVIENLPYDCRTNQEEIFGPVATLIPFDTEEEVLTYANSTAYGLAAILWTRNLSRAHRLSERLQAGIVWVNCWMLRDLRTPFGGVKQSGVGREGGWDALRFFTEPKNICIKYV